MAAAVYHFYFQLNAQSFPADVLECQGDSDAVAKTKELLDASTTFRLMEVWQSERKVGIIERGWISDRRGEQTDVE